MTSTRALLVVLVALSGVVGATVAVAQPVAPPGGPTGPGGADAAASPADAGERGGGGNAAAGTDQGPPNGSQNNTSMGSQISSFMQTSSASAQGSVDNGMWAAQVNGSDNDTKRRLVEGRAAALENRLDRLYAQKAQLIAKYENGTISRVAYEARMSRIAADIAAIEAALNQTEPVARQVGANVTQIERLRSAAANLSGPEVAAVARNISGFTPGFAGERGNSTRGGGQGAGQGQGHGNQTGGQGNTSVGQNGGGAANGTVGTGNSTGGTGNGTGAGNVTGGQGNTTGGQGNTTGGQGNTSGGQGNATGGQGASTGGAGNGTGTGSQGGTGAGEKPDEDSAADTALVAETLVAAPVQ